jgi:transmembrane sensor
MTQPNLAQIEQQAMLWQARLSSDLCPEADRIEFQQWLQQSPAHQKAWQDINQFWSSLDTINLDDLVEQKTHNRQFIKFKSRPVKTALALAASLLLALGLFLPKINYYLADYNVAAGQQKQITLSDGSSILLNTNSAFSVSFNQQQRLITLHQGEAFFQVATDKTRPFIVQTSAGQVRALGTAFDVKQQDQQTQVIVFEHAVSITTTQGLRLEKLQTAEQLKFSADSVQTASKVNLQRAAPWHQQRMVFQDKALVDVVAELNRYRSGKIICLNDSIKNLPITGVFGIADTELALQAIEQSLPVRITRITDQLILLSQNK